MASKHDWETETAARLPLRLTLVCFGLGLALFFTTSAPAWTERAQLADLLDKKQKLRHLLDESNAELFSRSEALDWDVQALLVEIDRQGMTPDELLQKR